MEPCFAYFNSGTVAGSSQPHKHMQVVPLENLPNKKIPIDERVLDTMKRAELSNQANTTPVVSPKNAGQKVFGNMSDFNTNAYAFLEPETESYKPKSFV